MQTKMLVKKPEAVSNKTNSPVNNNLVNNKPVEEKKPVENKKNVRTTDYKKLMQIMLNDPDAITREEFLYLQSIIGYRRAMAMREEARLRKRKNKIEQTDIRKPITLQKINSDDKNDSNGKKEASESKNSNGKSPLQMKKDKGNTSAASSSGIPSNLKAGLEQLSGVDLSDVKVHQNSNKPQQVGALAYTQGNDIHVAPGQEKHIPHEGWHAVQQKQGIVEPTMQMKTGTLVNDDAGLEKEADMMGAKAAEIGKDISSVDASNSQSKNSSNSGSKGSGDFVVQKKDEGTESKPKISESDLEELQLKGMTDFKATTKIDEYLKENTSGANIKVRYGNLASGTVKISKSGQNYKMTPQAISLLMNPFSSQGNMVKTAQPSLIISINNGMLIGFLGIANGSKVPDSNDLLSQLISDPSMFGLRGLTLDKSLQIVNSINDGRLEFGIRNATVKVGGVFDCTISFEFEPDTGKISFSGTANIDVKGLATGNLTLERSSQGNITGTAELAVNLSEHLTGGVKVNVDGERVIGEGNVGYSGEKLSGQVTLRLTDKNSMPSVGTDLNAATKPEPQNNKSENPEYVLAGEGDLTFMFTDWLSGTAHAEVDEKGNVTIVGQIVPQKELVLFEQTDYIKPLFDVEARASYGIPVVGNIFLFASIGLEAFAKLGPAKLYNIIAEGTYSTDTEKCNDFSIQASLNISAAAGVRLIGKAGAGLEILGHDIKAGASLTAIAGLSAYAEATPIIGYKENAMPGQDKKGDFFISGELEIAAQPFFALEGDIFVEIDSPWWSPLSDEKWTWPLLNKSYPLGGSFGIMAKVNHVLGSKQVPEIEFGKVDFSADKFMTDLINDNTSSKKTEEEQQGKWNEKNSEAAQPPKDTKDEKDSENGKDSTLNVDEPKTSSTSGNNVGANPNAMTADGKTVKQYQDETLQNQGKSDVKPNGANETIDKTSSEKKNQDQQLIKGLAELKSLNTKYDEDGGTKDELLYEVNSIKEKYSALKSVNIVDGSKDWDFKYGDGPDEVVDGPKKGDKELSPKAKFKIGSEEHELWVERSTPKDPENVVMMASDTPNKIEKKLKLKKDLENKIFKLKKPKNKKVTQNQVDAKAKEVEKDFAGEREAGDGKSQIEKYNRKKHYGKTPTNSARIKTFDRDNYTCQYCGRRVNKTTQSENGGLNPEADHSPSLKKHYESEGYKMTYDERVKWANSIENLKTACRDCNRSKQEKSYPDEWVPQNYNS